MAASADLTFVLGLLTTYCYSFLSVMAIPDRKDAHTEEEWPLRRSYKLEDFLWSGSGDGQGEDIAWHTTTIIRTTTILATIYPTPVYTTTYIPESPRISFTCTTSGCLSSTWTGLIEPTPTMLPPHATASVSGPPTYDIPVPDQRFWMVTVIQTSPNTKLQATKDDLQSRLAKLYKLAFNRQQERHLGIGNETSQSVIKRRTRDQRPPEVVNVHLHNRTEKEIGKWELLYTVHVGNKPVLAQAAAADMKLVSAEEVTAELGYPVLTKAEPYLKVLTPVDGKWKKARTRDTWLLVGAAVAAVALLLLLAVLVALGLGKRKRNKRRVLATNRRQVFDKEAGASNLAYHDSEKVPKLPRRPDRNSPGFLAVGPTTTTAALLDDGKTASRERKSSTTSMSSSGASETSLVRRRPGPHTSKTISKPENVTDKSVPQPLPRKKQTVTQNVPDEFVQIEHERHTQKDENDADELQEVRNTDPVVAAINTAISPNSYLSMPSIKSFPRGANIPESLAIVLDASGNKQLEHQAEIIIGPTQKFARHGSLEGEDPGVVGPLVWDMHCHQMQYQHEGIDENIDDIILGATQQYVMHSGDQSQNAGRTRRRFHDLLDDAFSLFGSRSDDTGPEEEEEINIPPTLHRVHSAIVRPIGEPLLSACEFSRRPRTTDARRPATAVSRPRGAWGTAESSPPSGMTGSLPRPLSAGPFHRPRLPGSVGELTIDRALILSESQLPPMDPAIPLIAAIKEELQRFRGSGPPVAIPLPGVLPPKRDTREDNTKS